MKSSITAILLIASLFIAANADTVLNGFDQIEAPAGAGSSCFLTLQAFQTSDSAMTLSQFWHDPLNGTAPEPNGTCINQNFTFASIFFQEASNLDRLPYNGPDNDTTFANTTFDAAALYKHNGTSCFYLPENVSGFDQYMCNFMYGNTMVPLVFYGNGNFSFSTNDSVAPAWVLPVNDANKSSQTFEQFFPNSTFPFILVNMYDTCSNPVHNLTSINGPVLIASSENLTADIPTMWLAWTIVKPWGSTTPGDYIVVKSNSNNTIFKNLTNSSCVPMGMNYNDLVPDLNYCGLGCEVTFVMTDNSSIYLFQTTGLWTVGDNTPAGGSGSNGTNTNNTNAANSAENLVMNLSLATLVLAFMYLVLFEGM